MLKKFLFVTLLFLVLACSQETPVAQSSSQPASVNSASVPVETPVEAEHLLVFFLDPNGGPCRMQNKILEDMAEEFQGKVGLRYVMTTVKDDLQYFYAYGVRGLPSLILTDKSGKEVKRLPPGVNQADSIRELLKSVPN